MDIKEYALTRDLPMQTALKLLDREELSLNLQGHFSASTDENGDETITLDDTAVDILDEYIVFRPEDKNAYSRIIPDSEMKSPESVKKSKQFRIAIAAIALLFVYYMTAFVLNLFGVITKSGLAIMVLPVSAAIIIGYIIIREKKNRF